MVSIKKFDQKAMRNGSLSAVLFKTEWNASCQLVSMIFKDLAETYQQSLDFYTADFDSDTESCGQYGVREIPTILLIKNGSVLDHSVGLISKSELSEKIASALDHSKKTQN